MIAETGMDRRVISLSKPHDIAFPFETGLNQPSIARRHCNPKGGASVGPARRFLEDALAGGV